MQEGVADIANGRTVLPCYCPVCHHGAHEQGYGLKPGTRLLYPDDREPVPFTINIELIPA